MIEYDSRRWREQLFALRGSVVPKVFWRVMILGAWSAIVVLLDRRVVAVQVPATVHTLIGVALGLLLVFRTNASYDRFWEGRKAWGNIVNHSRNIVRATRGLFADRPGLHDAIALWTAAYSYACMHTLRGERGIGPMAARLPAAQVAAVVAAPHVPVAVATELSKLLSVAGRGSTYAERVAIAIDGMVRSLVDDLGTCERIQKTPLPFAYVVHLRRALLLYLTTLPFALVDAYGWSAVAYALLIGYILLGIDEIGVEIENPFGTDHNDLPLEKICAGIEAELLTELNGCSP